jgi:phage tail P2-like protein
MSTVDRVKNYSPGAGTVLPSNATPLELTLDKAEGNRLWGTLEGVNGTSGLHRQVPQLWDAQNAPMSMLPLLAWAFRLDFFDSAWPERFQREMVASARRINELRGTVAGIKLTLKLLGHPNAQVVENPGVRRRGDGGTRDSLYRRAKSSDWATFSIVLENPISDRQYQILRQAVDRVKRNCCHLVEMNQPKTPLLRGLGHVRGSGKVRGTV